jgi:hypothetical protein
MIIIAFINQHFPDAQAWLGKDSGANIVQLFGCEQ